MTDDTIASAPDAPVNPISPVVLDDTVGLGVDIVAIDRMRQVLQRTPRFKQRVYTQAERDYCESTNQPHIHYATRFAAKEAVVKALGTGFSEGIAPADIEVLRNAKGRPTVGLYRAAKEVAKVQGVLEMHVSLSYTHNDAVACAMAITKDATIAAEKRVDPMEELAKQFKEARTMLDEIGTAPKEASADEPAVEGGVEPKQAPQTALSEGE